MNYFCTYCDQGYAARMRCLHESLKAQGEPFRLLVLCFDQLTEAAVTGARDPSLVAIPIAELLAADSEYAAVQPQRSRVEFFFTSTPVLVKHCLEREPAAAGMTYLDADLFFFRPASEVWREQGDASIGIVPHRFPPRLANRAVHGTYNVGWVSFRRDAHGLVALHWWRERCLEWCHDRLEAGRFADQGYLDEFPQRFAGVRVLDHPGINAAPWNVDGAAVAGAVGNPTFGGTPILFYHFQGIREVAPGWFDPGLGTYQVRLTNALRDLIYAPYLRRLTAMQAKLQRDHGIEPVRGYLRVPTDSSWSARWERFRAGGAMALYRRLRGRLMYLPEPAS
jgi:hypothetical protein